MQLIQQWKLLENTRRLELLVEKKIRYEFFYGPAGPSLSFVGEEECWAGAITQNLIGSA